VSAVRALLLSNSTAHGRGYLDHAEAAIRDFLGPVRRVLFFPYALADRAAYVATARERFGRMGIALDAAGSDGRAQADARTAEAFFVGGGNTFRLLAALEGDGLLETVRDRVRGGVPYVGSSAGSIVAGPTIKTTKDMPIVQPRSFGALAIVPFQISPHYLDPDPASRHMGETQEERIRQFHEEPGNDAPVAGLREGSILRVEADEVEGEVELLGLAGARFFRKDTAPVERRPVCSVADLLVAATSADAG
jgi:dipeptidase E